jgi:hypothetical protein
MKRSEGSANIYKKIVLDEMKALLKPIGFRKKGQTFWRELAGVIHLINLQSSSASTSSSAKVTVNIAVLAPQALNSWDSPYSVWSAQWRARLGELSPDKREKWWQLHDLGSARGVANQIVTDLESFGLPALAEFASVSSLVSVLETGDGHGHTVAHQKKLATRIKNSMDTQLGCD